MAYEVENRQEREELEEEDEQLSQVPRDTWVSESDDFTLTQSSLTSHEEPTANGQKQPKTVSGSTPIHLRPNERNQSRTPVHINSNADKAKGKDRLDCFF